MMRVTLVAFSIFRYILLVCKFNFNCTFVGFKKSAAYCCCACIILIWKYWFSVKHYASKKVTSCDYNCCYPTKLIWLMVSRNILRTLFMIKNSWYNYIFIRNTRCVSSTRISSFFCLLLALSLILLVIKIAIYILTHSYIHISVSIRR